MTWLNLLFLHWRVEPAVIRKLVPKELDIDTFDGSAWVGLVPFQMHDCRFAGFSRLPTLSTFYECNVRTYVRYAHSAGVWFFSLDAQNLLPVIGGRCLWNLNYIHSKFNVTHTPARSNNQNLNQPQTQHPHQTHDYALRRRTGPWPNAHTHIRWTVGDPLPPAQPGSLEHFLTERYYLFTKLRGRIKLGRIHHNPWPLHNATTHLINDTLIKAAGLNININNTSDTTPPDSILASPTLHVTGDRLQQAQCSVNNCRRSAVFHDAPKSVR